MDKKLTQYVESGELSLAEAMIASDMLTGKKPLTAAMALRLAIAYHNTRSKEV